MNIIEAYIKFKNDLLIYISSINGCGKSIIGKKLAEDMNLKYIDQLDYYKNDFNETKILSNGNKITNWYSINSIDWVKFNDDIKKYKNNGLIVSGFIFPKNIALDSDYHIHLSFPKKTCLEKRIKMIENKKHKFKYNDINTQKLIMNQIIYPHEQYSIKNSNIDKFINSVAFDFDKIYDNVWDYLINSIQKFIDYFNKNKFQEWIKNNSI